MKKWYVYAKKADFDAIAEKYKIDKVTARVLRNREVNSDGQIEKFLNGTLDDLYSPLLLPDAIRLMNNLNRAIAAKQKIRIVGDYDVDGVCATYILYRGLSKLGADVSYDIPDRIKDGYGINAHIIDRAKKDGVSVILTCDNGIAAIDELKHARDLGMTVLVTDHHDVRQNTDEDYGCESRDILPPAAAVVDAKRESSRYPFPEICGAVVAWKMITMLYQNRGLPAEEYQEFLPFAAIATICDVVKLQDENRIIVREGLSKLKESGNIGLDALLQVTTLFEMEKISAYHIGFILGPCINAGGRLESAKIALELFLSEDRTEAFEKAVKLKELNDSRKDMTKQAADTAVKLVETEYASDDVLVVYLPTLHESLAGIVAGRLREKFYRPSFVVTDAEDAPDGTKMAKGSGRSIDGYPMSTRLAEVADLLTKFGGHPLAAGFSLPKANIETFRKALNEKSQLTPELLDEKIWIDLPMPLSYISAPLIHDLEKLEPFGQGNEKPKFAWKGLFIREARVVGKNRNCVRMLLQDRDGTSITAMLFSGADDFVRDRRTKMHIDIIYYPSINEYNGTQSLQVVIEDYKLRD